MHPLSAAAVADALSAQGIAIAPGRAERIAQGLAPTVAAVIAASRDLPLDCEPAGFAAALARRAPA
jgi:hypothetical protein